MKIICLSDLHGHLPKIPDCDLLLLGGDYCPYRGFTQEVKFIQQFFKPWLEQIVSRGIKVVGVAGNHDFLFQDHPSLIDDFALPWIYLQDNGCEVGGLNIWGSPWQPIFHNWAFNLSEVELEKKWALIPDWTNILLLHGPPQGLGDFTKYDHVNTGSSSLRKRIVEIDPSLVVFGHIHEGRGEYKIKGNKTIFINASYVNVNYEPYKLKMTEVEL